MASTHHFYYRDFRDAVGGAGLTAVSETLRLQDKNVLALRKALYAAQKTRDDYAKEILESAGEQLRPHLRPCHQRQIGKGLQIYSSFWD